MGIAGREAGAGAVQGGASGAAIGTMIMPGLGTAIGGGLGLLGGAIGGFIKGRGDQERMKQKQQAWLRAQQLLQQARGQQFAGRSQAIQTSYAPMSNMLGAMYGQSAAPNVSAPAAMGPSFNPAASAPRANTQRVTAGKKK